MSTLSKEEVQKFVEKRLVLVNGKINEDQYNDAKSVIGELLMDGAPDLAVIIDSRGGDLEWSWDIYDLIKTYPGKKTAIVISQANSGASLIVQACDVRLCAEHASMTVHNMTCQITFNILKSHRRVARFIKGRTLDQEEMYRVYSDRTGLSKKKIQRLSEKEKGMELKELLSLNFIDGVLTRREMAKWFKPDQTASKPRKN